MALTGPKRAGIKIQGFSNGLAMLSKTFQNTDIGKKSERTEKSSETKQYLWPTNVTGRFSDSAKRCFRKKKPLTI